MMENTTHPIVRPPWNDMVTIKRYLDAGVQSFLVPTVQSAEEAAQAVAYTRYPPDGVRGFAVATRASRFGRIRNYHQRAPEEICVLVQIETQKGLDNLEEIAGVKGVDGVFIGPGDLSAGIGYLGDQGHADVQQRHQDRDRARSRRPATSRHPHTGREARPRLHRGRLRVHGGRFRQRPAGARVGADRAALQGEQLIWRMSRQSGHRFSPNKD